MREREAIAVVQGEHEATLAAVRAKAIALRDAEVQTEKIGQKFEAAKGAADMRRLELGRALVVAHELWPSARQAQGGARGPGGQTWEKFLEGAGLSKSTAWRYMEIAKPGSFQSEAMERPVDNDRDEDDDDQTGPRIAPRTSGDQMFRRPSREEAIAYLASMSDEDRKHVLKSARVNLAGGSEEVERGTWCTNAVWARAVGAWDIDPFSNERSKIESAIRCMLEDGGDGFGGDKPGDRRPGLYLTGDRHGNQSGIADELTRVWLQPPYEIVLEVLAHYLHTRFCALLRFSPDVEWFRRLWPKVEAVAIPLARIDFDPPPGIAKPKSSIPYPHALYYACARDITSEVRKLSLIWTPDHNEDEERALASLSSQLHIVH